jgi:hypothetical protein
VRLRLKNTSFSQTKRIAVDLPLLPQPLHIQGVCDGITWTPNEVGATLTCWVEGLPENADIANVRLYLAGRKLPITWIAAHDASGVRQINANVPPASPSGDFQVECAGTIGLLACRVEHKLDPVR